MRLFSISTVICALSSLPLLTGCSGEDGTGTTSTVGNDLTYVRDIEPLLNAKCVNCHTAGGIGPFALDTYEQVAAAKGAVKASVESGSMPPWMPGDGCTDYKGDFSLTDEQIKIIGSWIDAGAPLGDPNDTPVVVEKNFLELSRVDFELTLPVAYTPKQSPDDYRCFLIDWPEATTTYVTGFGVEPDNKAIVHHVIGFLAVPDQVANFQALDDADPEPGWTCYGGPSGGAGQGGARAAWVGAWVPGGSGEDLPAGTGIEIPAGSKIIAQMHYNTLGAQSGSDQTKLLFQTSSTVEKKAAIMPFANPSWIQAGTMTIAPNTKGVVHSFAADPTLFVKPVTNGALQGGKPLTFYAAGAHMHTLGKRSMARIERADGTKECLLDLPRWDFNWQGRFSFQAPKVVNPGEKLFLECQWDNNTMQEVSWGEGTQDEMCLGTYYVTE